jgi:two-component system phosphate regulon sensor histidine kinase PhoR
MKTSKNLLVLILMAASVVLLLVLEILWLKNAYRNEKTNFTRIAYFLFSNTAMSLQDSLNRKIIVHLPAESNFKSESDIQIHESLKPDMPPLQKRNPGRANRIIRLLISELSPGKFPNTFKVRLTGDSINLISLKEKFNEELNKAGIILPCTIQVKKGNTIPSWVYSVHFENTGIYAVEKISPQGLFCTTLTLLILISFYSMYRNILTNQRLVELKNDFISNITHELKTPISTVSVAIEALQNFNAMKDPDKASQYLDIAARELNRLDLMADKILSTKVFEHKGVEFKNESVDLKKLATRVLDSMQLVFEKRKAHVTLEEEGGDYTVSGSAVHLTDILYNLIDNALKYGPPGVQIDLQVKSGDRYVEFSVTDNGPGISPEYHKKIFDKFSRIPSGDVHNTKGYGLGLHYVKEVVKSHHGTIGLVSRPGTGSIFTIRIPKAHA